MDNQGHVYIQLFTDDEFNDINLATLHIMHKDPSIKTCQWNQNGIRITHDNKEWLQITMHIRHIKDRDMTRKLSTSSEIAIVQASYKISVNQTSAITSSEYNQITEANNAAANNVILIKDEKKKWMHSQISPNYWLRGFYVFMSCVHWMKHCMKGANRGSEKSYTKALVSKGVEINFDKVEVSLNQLKSQQNTRKKINAI